MENSKLKLPELEPWPEQVDGAALLDALSALFRRHLALPARAEQAMALWVVSTHVFEVAQVSPRLALLSPLPECGKTTALSLLGRLVNKPLLASNLSPPVVYRAIERHSPTLLLDEADTYLEQSEAFRGLLNSGHTRETAFVWRCVGEDHEPQRFTTWAPMAIAKIGSLPDTLTTRSIIIPMHRKAPDEQVEKFHALRHGAAAEELARKAARWASDHLHVLVTAAPDMPKELTNRAADNWTPLLAIADAAGGEWPEGARLTAAVFCGWVSHVSSQEQLLADIRGIFDQLEVDRISSAELCGKLRRIEDRLWGSVDGGFYFSPNKLAFMLRPFGIYPRSIRLGLTTPKGYLLKDFQESFARYLPQKRKTATEEEEKDLAGCYPRNEAA